MNKFLKCALIILLGAPLLGALLIGLFLQFKDANDYRENIEQQAKQRAGINLSIKGPLSWSLFPLGLDIHELTVQDQQLNHFASAKRILAQVDFLSLFSPKPTIHTLTLEGAQVSLFENAEGHTNWSNILPETEVEPPNTPQQTTTPLESEASVPLGFLVTELQILDLALTFKSSLKNIDLQVAPVNIVISNIAPDQNVPIDISFAIRDAINQLNIDTKVESDLIFSSDLKKIEVAKFNSEITLHGAITNNQKLLATLNSQLAIDTQNELIDIAFIQASLDSLSFESQLSIKQYGTQADIGGSIKTKLQALPALLEKLSISLPSRSDPNTLQHLSLNTNFSFKEELLALSSLDLQLDQSTWKGNLSINTLSKALKAKFNGNKIDLDRYLPIKTDATKNDKDAQALNLSTDPEPSTTDNQVILPLETLRDLDINIAFTQDSLSIKKVGITDLGINLSAKNGVLRITNFTAQTHQGTQTLEAQLDARTNTPTWQATSKLSALDLGALSETLAIQKSDDMGSLSGILNLDATFSASRNTLETLKQSALADAHFELQNGEVKGLNLKALSCEGIALVNRDTISTRNWPLTTSFDTLKGKASLKHQKLKSDFALTSSALSIDASALLDMASEQVDITMGLKVIGDTDETACRVNEKFKDLAIPARCKGHITTPPAELCTLDKPRLLDATKHIAVTEGKRKLDKELNRALDKHLGDDKAELKDAAKNLFKKLF